MKKLILLLIFLPAISISNNLEPHKKICAEIGFEPKTEEFANCVMDFFKKSKTQSQNTKNESKPSTSSNVSSGISKQNRLIEEQLELQKKIYEEEKLRRFKKNNLIILCSFYPIYCR